MGKIRQNDADSSNEFPNENTSIISFAVLTKDDSIEAVRQINRLSQNDGSDFNGRQRKTSPAKKPRISREAKMGNGQFARC
ncbi:hypothetical protein Y032_0027g1570 [Ancylostoma ceylanicum]|uniref:Uncharacterized protein n=1 Tax=Ancylostoma ceylanicum TaxID=53326 RepID=A0A016UTR6_9BILA|nr:hypothetical protein Y032_0027g1570 [Ancylostoma ceylanicum]